LSSQRLGKVRPQSCSEALPPAISKKLRALWPIRPNAACKKKRGGGSAPCRDRQFGHGHAQGRFADPDIPFLFMSRPADRSRTFSRCRERRYIHDHARDRIVDHDNDSSFATLSDPPPLRRSGLKSCRKNEKMDACCASRADAAFSPCRANRTLKRNNPFPWRS
jgi:hypothetical protein